MLAVPHARIAVEHSAARRESAAVAPHTGNDASLTRSAGRTRRGVRRCARICESRAGAAPGGAREPSDLTRVSPAAPARHVQGSGQRARAAIMSSALIGGKSARAWRHSCTRRPRRTWGTRRGRFHAREGSRAPGCRGCAREPPTERPRSGPSRTRAAAAPDSTEIAIIVIRLTWMDATAGRSDMCYALVRDFTRTPHERNHTGNAST
jgi:hypothetical protein